jgi:hypothetical protein
MLNYMKPSNCGQNERKPPRLFSSKPTSDHTIPGDLLMQPRLNMRSRCNLITLDVDYILAVYTTRSLQPRPSYATEVVTGFCDKSWREHIVKQQRVATEATIAIIKMGQQMACCKPQS